MHTNHLIMVGRKTAFEPMILEAVSSYGGHDTIVRIRDAGGLPAVMEKLGGASVRVLLLPDEPMIMFWQLQQLTAFRPALPVVVIGRNWGTDLQQEFERSGAVFLRTTDIETGIVSALYQTQAVRA